MNQKQENKKQDQFNQLEEFSQDLLKLGKDIGQKLQEKETIEQEVVQKEGEARKLRAEIFQLKEKLIKISSELLKLEQRRKQIKG